MDTHQETEYVLSNPLLMQQIRQFKDKSEQDSTKLNNAIDFDYVLSNPDLIPQVQLLIEAHKQKNHALSRIS